MKRMIWFFLLGAMSVACAGKTGGAGSGQRTVAREASQVTGQAPVEPHSYGYRVVRSYPHSTESYTQGLEFADGVLWESTGMHGRSHLQRVDLATGRAKIVASLPHEEFGEGITILNGKVYQLTWTSNKAYVYDATSGKLLQYFTYPGEGWGLTNDGTNLYMSDGSDRIRVVDPADFRMVRSVAVTYKGRPVQLLNELEWIDGKIWANVYTTDQIAIIDPASGRIEGLVDLRGLLSEEQITDRTDVLNGIAAQNGRIFVTGKNWSRLFEIELTEP